MKNNHASLDKKSAKVTEPCIFITSIDLNGNKTTCSKKKLVKVTRVITTLFYSFQVCNNLYYSQPETKFDSSFFRLDELFLTKKE